MSASVSFPRGIYNPAAIAGSGGPLFQPAVRAEIEACRKIADQVLGEADVSAASPAAASEVGYSGGSSTTVHVHEHVYGHGYYARPLRERHTIVYVGRVPYSHYNGFGPYFHSWHTVFVPVNSRPVSSSKDDNAALRILIGLVAAAVLAVACYQFGRIYTQWTQSNIELEDTQKFVEKTLIPAETSVAEGGRHDTVETLRNMVDAKRHMFKNIIRDQQWSLGITIAVIASAALCLTGALIAANALIITGLAIGAITLAVACLRCGCNSVENKLRRPAQNILACLEELDKARAPVPVTTPFAPVAAARLAATARAAGETGIDTDAREPGAAGTSPEGATVTSGVRFAPPPAFAPLAAASAPPQLRPPAYAAS